MADVASRSQGFCAKAVLRKPLEETWKIIPLYGESRYSAPDRFERRSLVAERKNGGEANKQDLKISDTSGEEQMAFALAYESGLTSHCWRRQLSTLGVSRVSSREHFFLSHCFLLPVMALAQRASLAMGPLLVGLALMGLALTAPARAAEKVELSVDVSKTGPKIDRNIFGQFAEHLGHGVYDGIWVGPDSTIPNTRGIRNDVVAALKAIKVPNVRWPGGCFADEYHWRNGISRQRVVTLNPNWGGVIEPNTFGTHEFMDFLDQIGSEAYISINVGSGTPREAAEWLEYMTAAHPTTLSKERAANGHPAAYKVGYLGIGNESWACGGNMTPDYYLSQLKIYSRFVRNFNPAQEGKQQMLKIAVGPGGDGPEWTEWTEAIMRAYQHHEWSWDINGLSMHSYTVVRWPPSFASAGFGETEYSQILKATLGMEDLINKHSAIMDKYDPQKKVALVVDEWGARGEHRPDGQRAAGHDHGRQRKDGSDPDLLRL
jgi:hypothetical protein